MAIMHSINEAQLTTIISDMLEAAAKEPGVTAVAVGGSLDSGLSATVRLGEVETIEFNRDKSLGIMVYKGQRKGSVSITDLGAEAIDSAIKAACRIAEYTEPDPYSGLADKELLAKDIQDLQLYHPAAITAEQAIVYAKECEAAALSFDKKITNSDGATFGTHEQYYVYGNSDGFLAAYPSSRYSAHCVVIGQSAASMQRDYDYTVARDINNLMDMSQIGVNAAEKTLARLGAKKIKTCKAPVILVPKIATSFWNTLIAAISGGNLYRKSSFLLDNLNKIIFPKFVNLREMPHLLKGLGSAPFDSEGVATSEKNIIADGVLNTYLLSSYSARRLNMQTTGNSGGAHNVIVTPGASDYSQLIKQMGTGLIVTEFLGQGTNLVTGDFSQGAAGFWVENGEIQHPVEEITIAGNFSDMFKNLVAIGNDVDHRSNVITGSILLDTMTIAGS
jgi:PmbA protein